MSQSQNHVLFTQGDIAFLQHFVPATCPVKFNELNSVQHVAGTKLPKNSCCTSLELSGHTRQHIAATCPSDAFPLRFLCVYVMWLCCCYMSQLHFPDTCPQCVKQMILWLQHVATTRTCIIILCVREALMEWSKSMRGGGGGGIGKCDG